jgi:hypothetical protein
MRCRPGWNLNRIRIENTYFCADDNLPGVANG